MKGDEVVCYEPWENLCQQFRNGPCLEIKETMMSLEEKQSEEISNIKKYIGFLSNIIDV